MEMCEDIRHTIGMKDLYIQRKQTIERLFGTAKENHGFWYTQMFGKARMEMKAGLTFTCLNFIKSIPPDFKARRAKFPHLCYALVKSLRRRKGDSE